MCGKFWEWNKKMFNDPTPIVGWNYTNDGQGNSDFRCFIGGSKFWCKRGVEKISSKKKKLIETEEHELLE